MIAYTDEERRTAFWGKVDKSDECWLWTGCITESGYGQFSVVRPARIYAHRWSYEQEHGPIPAGMQLDHLCRVRNCVRPSHLEVVSPQVNTLRGETIAARNAAKIHCDYGHPLSGENLYHPPNGKRECRTCRQARRTR